MHEDLSETGVASVVADPPAASTARAIRRWAVLAGFVVLALVAGLVVLTPRDAADPERKSTAPRATTSAAPSSTTETDDPAAETARASAIRAILDRRASAVLRRDLTAWMADVDRSDPAFVAAQERVFKNLSQITFASWRYELSDYPAALQGESEKYGGPTYLPSIILRYAIKGYDEKPTAAATGWTFVSQGDDWKIASDSDMDGTLPSGHAAPWDDREMLVRQGKYVLLFIDTDDESHAGRFVRIADDAVRRVRQVWPDGWRRRVVISMVRDQAAYDTQLTKAQASVEFVAIATPLFTEVPGWTAPEPPERDSISTYRVTFNPRLFDPKDESNLDYLAHDVTHVATARYNSGDTPRWLFEGAAEYTARPDQIPSPAHLPDELKREVATGSVELPIDEAYAGPAVAPYRIGQFACYIIATRFGRGTLREIYRRLGPIPESTDVLDEQDKVFRALLGMSNEQFQRQVAAYIKQQS